MSDAPKTEEILAEAMADSWMGESVDCADVGTILAPTVDRLLDQARAIPPHDDIVEAISARLHITADTICDGGKPRHLSADTTAVHEAAIAVRELLEERGAVDET